MRERFLVRVEALKPGKVPSEPTTEPPGSKAKVAVMQSRVARGEKLFHPDDVTVWKVRTTDTLRAGGQE